MKRLDASGVINTIENNLKQDLEALAKRPDAKSLPIFKEAQTLVARVFAGDPDTQMDYMEQFLITRHNTHGPSHPKNPEPIRKRT